MGEDWFFAGSTARPSSLPHISHVNRCVPLEGLDLSEYEVYYLGLRGDPGTAFSFQQAGRRNSSGWAGTGPADG